MKNIKLFNLTFVSLIILFIIGTFVIAARNIEPIKDNTAVTTISLETSQEETTSCNDYYKDYTVIEIYTPVEESDVETFATDFVTTEESTFINQYELSLLAHLINGEAGATYCSDEMRYYVGSVVLNRVSSDYFPDTIEEVIFQKGQYACTWNDLGTDDTLFNREPSERCWEIAEDLLTNGSVLPQEVIFQAEFTQGDGTYVAIPFLNTHYMYFCYKY